MAPSRERGTVVSWKHEKGHGRIRSDEGDVLWAHFSYLEMSGFRALCPGQRVEFTRVYGPGPGVQRIQARDLVVVDSEP